MSRVLVAEDSASIRLLLRRRLEMAGHEVVDTKDGAEAVEAITGDQPEVMPDVVLLDAMMPRMNGAEALKAIKEISPGLPVLVVSALHELDQSDGWDMADGHLTKPIDFDELLARIDLATGGPPRPGSRNP